MLAVTGMPPAFKMIFFLVAVVFFVLGAIGLERGKVSFVSAGLAAFAFPFFWDALVAL